MICHTGHSHRTPLYRKYALVYRKGSHCGFVCTAVAKRCRAHHTKGSLGLEHGMCRQSQHRHPQPVPQSFGRYGRSTCKSQECSECFAEEVKPILANSGFLICNKR